jgi:methionyl-tRNA synthetase
VESKTPWVLRKDPDKGEELLEVCTVALNLFRQITVYLSPILPDLAQRATALLNAEPVSWESAATPLEGNRVAPFEHLMRRVDPARVEAMVEASKE